MYNEVSRGNKSFERAGHPRFIRAFALASAKLNKKRGSAKKKSAEKSESDERERKKERIRAFLSWGGDVSMYVCMYVCNKGYTYVCGDVNMWGCMYSTMSL